jgi:hypothetical protein
MGNWRSNPHIILAERCVCKILLPKNKIFIFYGGGARPHTPPQRGFNSVKNITFKK